MHLWWRSRAHKSEQHHAKPAKPRPAPCRLWWSGGCGVASLCARTRGEPSSAHCEQRLSERLTPCPCDPVCACRFNSWLLHALPLKPGGRAPPTASRSCRPATRFHRRVTTCPHRKTEKKPLASSACVPTRSATSRAGMAGWAGEGGGRFGERREYEAPTLPSTPRQHGMARHHTCQARNATHINTARLAPTPASRETARPHKPSRETAHDHHTSQPPQRQEPR